jgi:diaminopimelate epimerase
MERVFWKLAGAGNDFVLLHGQPGAGPRRWAPLLCDRRRGVGADGLLCVAVKSGQVTVAYYNADGSTAFCGNGTRCAAWWAYRQGLAGRHMTLNTGAGLLRARVVAHEELELEMPQPSDWRPDISARISGRSWAVHQVWTGAPHAVVFARAVDSLPVEAIGRSLREHPRLGPDGTNVDFVEKTGRALRMRTYERGVEAETWSCGTGAVAAAYAAWRLGAGRFPARVLTRGGRLTVRQDSKSGAFWLSGPARIIFVARHNL